MRIEPLPKGSTASVGGLQVPVTHRALGVTFQPYNDVLSFHDVHGAHDDEGRLRVAARPDESLMLSGEELEELETYPEYDAFCDALEDLFKAAQEAREILRIERQRGETPEPAVTEEVIETPAPQKAPAKKAAKKATKKGRAR